MWKRSAISGLFLLGIMISGVAYADGPPTRIIVKWRDNAVATETQSTASSRLQRRQQRLEEAGLRIGARLARLRTLGIGAESVEPNRSLSRDELRDVIATLKADPDVEYAEEDAMLQSFFTPNDTRYNEQWHYYESAGGLRLPAAWDRATGANVTVAVLDTGYRPHADLAANIVGGYDFIRQRPR
jgi:serine protease